MAIIQISYDLNQPGRDYSSLIARIKELGSQGWCKALESHWFIKIDASTAAVRDDLARHIDQSSRLLVMDVTGDAAAWFGLPQDVGEWLKANL